VIVTSSGSWPCLIVELFHDPLNGMRALAAPKWEVGEVEVLEAAVLLHADLPAHASVVESVS